MAKVTSFPSSRRRQPGKPTPPTSPSPPAHDGYALADALLGRQLAAMLSSGLSPHEVLGAATNAVLILAAQSPHAAAVAELLRRAADVLDDPPQGPSGAAA